MSEMPRCGRLTLSGSHCRAILYDPLAVACGIHATEQDEAVTARLHDREREQWAAAFKAGEESAQRRHEAAAREAAKPDRFRLTEGGRQIIRCGRYAYTWDGDEPLALGDRVLLPSNWLFKETREAEVTGFGTDYDGSLSRVIRRIVPEVSQ